jgi:hypothetical protein
MYRMRSVVLAFVLVLSFASSGTESSGMQSPRTYRMGFSFLPPRLTIPEVLRTIDEVGKHADGALMVVEVPWKALLDGASASQLVRKDNLPVAQMFRQRGLPIVATVELANGLDRHAEAQALVALGRSIAEPAVQRAYREFVVAFDSIVHPDWLGLAMETNLIRAAAKPAVYGAVVAMTNAAAADLRASGSRTTLMVSVQVETAWGRLAGGGGGRFVGVERDRTDFRAGARTVVLSVPRRLRDAGAGSARSLHSGAGCVGRTDDGRRGRMDVGVGAWRGVVAGAAGTVDPPADAARRRGEASRRLSDHVHRSGSELVSGAGRVDPAVVRAARTRGCGVSSEAGAGGVGLGVGGGAIRRSAELIGAGVAEKRSRARSAGSESIAADVETGIVAQRIWGAEFAEERGAAEDCSRGRDL